jgi:aminopeptidase N
MEYPNLVYISNEVTDNSSYQQVIIHEIAHQWWYSLVGNSEVSYAWLDEGLTEYTTALFYELHPEYEVSKNTLITNAYNSYSLFIEVYCEVYGTVNTTMNRDLNEFTTEQEYVYVAYVKGMLLFDSLREIIGYDNFIKCLQDYFSDYSYQNVTPSDLIASFEKSSKVNLESYFNAWIDGKIILLK